MKHYTQSKHRIDTWIDEIIIQSQPKIQEQLSLAFYGGKRLRPVLCYEMARMTLEAHPSYAYDLDKAAVICMIPELIHTASLIIDDCPAMDNDTMRRNLPTIHIKYGETTAHILALHLVGLAYDYLYMGYEDLQDCLPDWQDRLLLSVDCLSTYLGLFGAPLGQYLDLNHHPKDSREQMVHLIEKKTATFFECSVMLGYILGGGDIHHIESTRHLGNAIGQLLQLSDDVEDHKTDLEHQRPNIFNTLGFASTSALFDEHLGTIDTYLETHDQESKIIRELQDYFQSKRLRPHLDKILSA